MPKTTRTTSGRAGPDAGTGGRAGPDAGTGGRAGPDAKPTRWDSIAEGRVAFPVNDTMGFALQRPDNPQETISYTWTIPESYANAEGNLQGGVMAAFIDAVLGTVTTPYLPEDTYPTLAEMKVSFFRPARVGTRITGTGRVLKRGRRVFFVEAEVVGEDGKLLAKASGTEIPSPVTKT